MSSLATIPDALRFKKTDGIGFGITYSYQYDSANRLIRMRNPDYVEVSYQYDPAGRLLTRILSNGTTTAYTYDANSRLVSLTTEHANGSVIDTETYTHDRLGNILTQESSIGTTAYTYDPLYRLTLADYPGTLSDYTYTYDAVGNRLMQTVGTSTHAYIYNQGNRLEEIRDGSFVGPVLTQFIYDDEGNMIERRDGASVLLQSYTPDAKGRITRITTNGVPFDYTYDPFDYRIAKAGSGGAAEYLLAGEHIETITGGHQPAQFFRGVVVDEIVNGYQFNPEGVWTNYTYAHDALQSVVGLTGHEGRTIQTTQYSPFGNEIAEASAGASCSVLRYTGREHDAENGLYYYRARYYDPELGRFLTEDPLGFQAGINFYAYVGNNPINANDPSGKICLPCVTGVIGATTGALGNAIGQVFDKGGFTDFSLTEVGISASVGFVAGAVAPWTAATWVGAAATGALANVAQYGITQTVNGGNFAIKDASVASVTGAAGGLIGGRIIRSSGYSETSSFLDTSLAKQLNSTADASAVTAKSAFARNIFGSTFSNINVQKPSENVVSSPSQSTASVKKAIYTK
jgi:RHS repeat-associated protein